MGFNILKSYGRRVPLPTVPSTIARRVAPCVLRACLNVFRPGWNGWNGTRLLVVVRSIPSICVQSEFPGNRATDPNRK